MKVSTKGRYGLRAMIDLAVYYTQGQITLSSIAARQNISESYLEQLLNTLKKAGLVNTVRGYQGGYTLAKKPHEITAGMVLNALEGSLAPVKCIDENNPFSCNLSEVCVTRLVWEKLRDGIYTIVDSITLKDLADKQRQLYVEKAGDTNGCETLINDFPMIVVNYFDENRKEQKLAFNGRWLLKKVKETAPDLKHQLLYSVALTEKGQLFVLSQDIDLPEKITYRVCSSLEKLKESQALPPEIINLVTDMLTHGDDIEFLDI